MKITLKPETIKYILAATALFIVLLFTLLSVKDKKVTEEEIKDETAPQIVTSAEEQSVYIVNDSTNQKLIIQKDPDLTKEEVMQKLNISEKEYNNSKIIIPAAVVGRQTSPQQLEQERREYEIFLEQLRDPGYRD